MKIGSIVIDCNEFDKMLAFWQEALHYVPKEPAKGGWVILRDPEGRSPNISLNQVSTKRRGRNRLHLDLYTDNREHEVIRLIKIGATRHPQEYEPGDDFVVLEDPDGNLFCVVEKKTDEGNVPALSR
jgi:catechol 2,3-dioxygenase-like lactoylglutathione lyase family enzyme